MGRMRIMLAAVVWLSVLFIGVACNEEANTAEESSIVVVVDAKRARELVDAGKVVVLDVRTPKEFEAGHIAGAVSINLYDVNFANLVANLAEEKEYMVHCASGYRSSEAVEILKKENLKKIYHFSGGMEAWEESGIPVEK